MIYIQQEINEFTYSNIENTTPTYNPTSNYMLGDMVRVGNYEYKSLFGTEGVPNKGNDPLNSLGISWFEYGSSNEYACLDPYPETKTIWEADGIVEFLRGAKNVLAIGNFTASNVKLEYLDYNNTVLETQEFTFSNNEGVYDEWTYGYGGFTSNTANTIYFQLKPIGSKIRITFSKNGNPTDCGFMTAGGANNCGYTLESVSFPDKRVGDRIIPTASFTTIVNNTRLMRTMNEAKKLINETVLFIIDEDLNSKHENMIFLGKIVKCDGVANNLDKNQINWQVEQNILI